MRGVNGIWKGKKLRQYDFLGMEDLKDFCILIGIPFEEVTIF